MEIYLIRHGETEWNTLRKLQGRSDTELNEVGIQLAQMTSKALEDILAENKHLTMRYRVAMQMELLVIYSFIGILIVYQALF